MVWPPGSLPLDVAVMKTVGDGGHRHGREAKERATCALSLDSLYLGILFSCPDATAHLKLEECVRLRYLEVKVLS